MLRMQPRLQQREVSQHAQVAAFSVGRIGAQPKGNRRNSFSVSSRRNSRGPRLDSDDADQSTAVNNGASTNTTDQNNDSWNWRYIVHVTVDLPDLREDVRAEFQLQKPHSNTLERATFCMRDLRHWVSLLFRHAILEGF